MIVFLLYNKLLEKGWAWFPLIKSISHGGGVAFSVLCAAILALALIVPQSAYACNAGTQSGNNSDGCTVRWDAKTIMTSLLTNDDPEYPNLMVDYETGEPVQGGQNAYTNGGYIQDVNKVKGDPGIMEIMHFYIGNGPNLTQVWRVAVATDYTMLNGKLTFRLPQEVVEAGAPVTFDASSTNARMKAWGGNYALYAWLNNKATAVDNHDGTWTVDLGDLPRGEATVFQFNVNLGQTSFTPEDRFIASAHLDAKYAPGTNGGKCDNIPDLPERPTLKEVGPCRAAFAGQTIWTIYDKDITQRYKIYGDAASPSDLMGEVNSDGWGAGADAWGEGSTRTLRLYAATKKELTNAEWVIDAVQGFTFEVPSGEVTYSAPGGGALQRNGYTNAVEGVTIEPSTDGRKIIVRIDHMAENSSVSFNMKALLDGSQKTLVVNHALEGDLTYCMLNPKPNIEYGSWTSTKSCSTKTVTQTRKVTTTPYVWDPVKLEYVPGKPVVTTETTTRPMTESELQACKKDPVVPPSPTPPVPPTPPTPLTPPTPPAPPVSPVIPDNPGKPVVHPNDSGKQTLSQTSRVQTAKVMPETGDELPLGVIAGSLMVIAAVTIGVARFIRVKQSNL